MVGILNDGICRVLHLYTLSSFILQALVNDCNLTPPQVMFVALLLTLSVCYQRV